MEPSYDRRTKDDFSQSAQRTQRIYIFFIAGERPAMKNHYGAIAHTGRRPEAVYGCRPSQRQP
jgi:hypothetical protein